MPFSSTLPLEWSAFNQNKCFFYHFLKHEPKFVHSFLSTLWSLWVGQAQSRTIVWIFYWLVCLIVVAPQAPDWSPWWYARWQRQQLHLQPPRRQQQVQNTSKHPYATLTWNTYLIKHTQMCLSFRPQHAWDVPQWQHPRPSSLEEVSLLV